MDAKLHLAVLEYTMVMDTKLQKLQKQTLRLTWLCFTQKKCTLHEIEGKELDNW